MSRVGAPPPGDVVDLGCGAGAVAGPLRERFPDRRLLGVDLSPAMLAEARGTGPYDVLVEADLAEWRPDAPPALIFSNAALNWVPDHAGLLPRLAGRLAPGGVLALQVPGQHDAPSHRLIREVAGLPPAPVHVLDPAGYEAALRPWGRVEAWETTYLQRLPAAGEGHPVRRFTEATVARPVIEAAPDRAALLSAYDAALARAYPPGADGSALLPFRRVFAVLVRAAA